MLKAIFVLLFMFIVIAVLWMPKDVTKTVHKFWQSNLVRSSIVYAEDNGVPATKILPKEEKRTSFLHKIEGGK
jgi:hypothetical protein